MMTEIKRWQAAYEQGIKDATDGTVTLEICEDYKDHEFYLKGYATVPQAKKEIKAPLTHSWDSKGYSSQIEEIVPVLPILF